MMSRVWIDNDNDYHNGEPRKYSLAEKTTAGFIVVLALGTMVLGFGAKNGTETDEGIIGCGVSLLDETPTLAEAISIIDVNCDRSSSLGKDQKYKHAEMILIIATNN